MGIYVDDLILASESLLSVNSLKAALSENFKMTDAGEIKTVLGIDVTRDREKGILTLSQERYALEILKKFRMQDCKPKDTPLEEGLKLTSEMSPKTEEELRNMENVEFNVSDGEHSARLGCSGATSLKIWRKSWGTALESSQKDISLPTAYKGLQAEVRQRRRNQAESLLRLRLGRLRGHQAFHNWVCFHTRRSSSKLE